MKTILHFVDKNGEAEKIGILNDRDVPISTGARVLIKEQGDTLPGQYELIDEIWEFEAWGGVIETIRNLYVTLAPSDLEDLEEEVDEDEQTTVGSVS